MFVLWIMKTSAASRGPTPFERPWRSVRALGLSYGFVFSWWLADTRIWRDGRAVHHVCGSEADSGPARLGSTPMCSRGYRPRSVHVCFVCQALPCVWQHAGVRWLISSGWMFPLSTVPQVSWGLVVTHSENFWLVVWGKCKFVSGNKMGCLYFWVAHVTECKIGYQWYYLNLLAWSVNLSTLLLPWGRVLWTRTKSVRAAWILTG